MERTTRRRARRSVALIILVGLVGCDASGDAPCVTEPAPTTGAEAPAVQAGPPTDRTYLPIPQAEPPAYTELDVRNVQRPDTQFAVRPPDGAPNVVVILVDDIGFGVASVFGGPVETPNLERLAQNGFRFTQFHTTALCSPTRMALQTGRNHHAANMGSITETATAFPGNTGQRPDDIATLAEMLRLNGYATAAFGKYHETAAWEVSPAGPFDRWPTRSGYEHFYGFLGGETNQWAPTLYDGETLIDPAQGRPGYHFTEDMTDHAIAWMQTQRTLAPQKPFYMYFATGATHAPHHVPAEWIARFRGRFDEGWDAFREQTLARQIAMGIVPAGTELAPKPADIPDWARLDADQKRLFARQMEIFAGFAAHTDHAIGRLLDALDASGQAENTLVVAIVGDNGSSAEGGAIGLFNEAQYFNGVQPTVEELLAHYDDFGGPESYGHMAAGWAVAGATPFTWTKQIASDFGGTRNPMILRWPARFPGDGSARPQFHHVVDVAPTILEAATLPEPVSVNGVRQRPMDGVSMLYALTAADAPTRHPTQYFEIFGNRAIYHEGWFARVIHFLPWGREPVHPLAEDVWELYDTRSDYSLRHDLAAAQPAKLAELQALFQREAERNHVFPLDDRRTERMLPEVAGRPDPLAGRALLVLHPGMHLTENAFPSLKNRSFAITAALALTEGRPSGVLLAQAGRFGGWAVYLDRGVPVFTYNFLGTNLYRVRASRPLRLRETQVQFEFVYEGGGLGRGGTVTIREGDEVIGSGRVERTQPFIFSADETADVGEDLATVVDPNYGEPPRNAFRGGTIQSVTVELR